jgi:hypothetical protein
LEEQQMLRMRGCLILCLSAISVLPACSGAQKADIALLESYLVGSFSSQEQHEADPDSFLDIRMQIATIWEDRHDGPWMYVEQALASDLDEPYRQRVYRLVGRHDGTIACHLYMLRGEPQERAGAWREDEPLADVKSWHLRWSHVQQRKGCSLILRREGDAFVGGTQGTRCRSLRRGGDYSTSEVTIRASGITSWERGYDAADRQIYGPRAGPYVYKKLPQTTDIE